jgi:hypothetical protein
MNITSGMLGWNRMMEMIGKRDHNSNCFAKVVSLRRFNRLVDHERAVNRPDGSGVSTVAWER